MMEQGRSIVESNTTHSVLSHSSARSFTRSSEDYSLKSQMYPTYIQKLPPSPKFTLFCSIANHFRVTGVFETSAPNYRKMTLSTKRSNVLHMHISATSDSHFHSFCSTASSFQVTCHFEASALNDHKMTLNTNRSMLQHINVTTTPKFQISFCLSLRLTLLPRYCHLSFSH